MEIECHISYFALGKASNWHVGSGLSMVLMIFIIISMVASAVLDKDGEGNLL